MESYDPNRKTPPVSHLSAARQVAEERAMVRALSLKSVGPAPLVWYLGLQNRSFMPLAAFIPVRVNSNGGDRMMTIITRSRKWFKQRGKGR